MERSSRNQVKDEQERAFQEAQLRDQEREGRVIIIISLSSLSLSSLSGDDKGAGGGTKAPGADR